MTLSELLDPDVVYAGVADVERYFRSKTFDGSSDPSAYEVEDMLREASETADDVANRTWRERRKGPREVEVKFSRKQRIQAERHSNRAQAIRRFDRWGTANLNAVDIEEIETLEVQSPRDYTDILDGEGRDADWDLDERRGMLRVRMGVFLVGPIRGSGLSDKTRVRVGYTYGRKVDTETPDDYDDETEPTVEVADVPYTVRKGVAKLVAADLIRSDSYTDLVPGGDSAPDQEVTADRWEEEAMENFREHRYFKAV